MNLQCYYVSVFVRRVFPSGVCISDHGSCKHYVYVHIVLSGGTSEVRVGYFVCLLFFVCFPPFSLFLRTLVAYLVSCGRG